MYFLGDVDWWTAGSYFVHIAVAYFLALPIAWDREQQARSAGLRTFPLVAIASCGYMLAGLSVLHEPEAQSRLMYGLMTGMGFIGGGAILKDKGTVRGTATAASLWNTGAIGMSVAWDRFEIAFILSAVNLATLLLFPKVKEAAIE